MSGAEGWLDVQVVSAVSRLSQKINFVEFQILGGEYTFN